jgi:carboxymethylenebutenolidase
MSENESGWITLRAEDGHQLRAYHAPAQRAEIGRIVLAPEIFGINHHIRAVCDGFAADGYRVIAPDLFERAEPAVELPYDKAGVERGIALKGQVATEAALLDLAAALAALGGGGSAAVVGYCWGGSLAWAAASRLPLRAAVAYYGGDIGNHLDDAPRVPTLLHFGEQDHAIPLTVPDEARRRHPTAALHLYPAGHGFNCDERGSFHADSAALARQRTLGMLRAVF